MLRYWLLYVVLWVVIAVMCMSIVCLPCCLCYWLLASCPLVVMRAILYEYVVYVVSCCCSGLLYVCYGVILCVIVFEYVVYCCYCLFLVVVCGLSARSCVLPCLSMVSLGCYVRYWLLCVCSLVVLTVILPKYVVCCYVCSWLLSLCSRFVLDVLC